MTIPDTWRTVLNPLFSLNWGQNRKKVKKNLTKIGTRPAFLRLEGENAQKSVIFVAQF